MIIKYKKLHPAAKAPFRATDGSAGWDLFSVAREEWAGGTHRHRTGLAFEVPPGHVMLLFPRSSIYRVGAHIPNSVGVIDSDYRGEVTLVFRGGKGYEPGERIGQAVIIPVPEVIFKEAKTLSETARGTGGYGSTGER